MRAKAVARSSVQGQLRWSRRITRRPRVTRPGGVQQPVAQSSRVPVLRLTGEGDAAEVAEQVVSGEHQLEPDLVLHEALEGEGAEPGLLGTSDLVLAAGAGSVASLEERDVLFLLVGDEDLETPALVIGEGELSSRVRTLSAADGAGARRPAREVELVELADLGALAILAVLTDGRFPGLLGNLEDGFTHLLPKLGASDAGRSG